MIYKEYNYNYYFIPTNKINGKLNPILIGSLDKNGDLSNFRKIDFNESMKDNDEYLSDADETALHTIYNVMKEILYAPKNAGGANPGNKSLGRKSNRSNHNKR